MVDSIGYSCTVVELYMIYSMFFKVTGYFVGMTARKNSGDLAVLP